MICIKLLPGLPATHRDAARTFEPRFRDAEKKRRFNKIHHAEMRRFGDILYLNCGDWVESCSAVVEHCDGSFEVVRWGDLQRSRVAACPRDAPFGALPPDDPDDEDVLEAVPGLSQVC